MLTGWLDGSDGRERPARVVRGMANGPVEAAGWKGLPKAEASVVESGKSGRKHK